MDELTTAIKPETASKGTVLVVDDEEDIRDLVYWRLSRSGYKVIQAKNGQEGVDAAFEKRPDLILMDVRMPRMSGLDAVKAIRACPETSHIPIVILTASVREDAVEQGYEAGADDYIKKPFQPAELLRRIELILAPRASA
jgi:DNA-binding response OmpR family regulator